MEREGCNHGELYPLILFTVVGMMLMASGTDLMTIFLGLEVMSVVLYVLAGFNRANLKSNEAGLKYFLLGCLFNRLPALRHGTDLWRHRNHKHCQDRRRLSDNMSATFRQHHAGGRHAADADRFCIQDRCRAVSHVDTGCLRRRTDSHDRFHVRRSQSSRFCRSPADLPGGSAHAAGGMESGSLDPGRVDHDRR